MAFHSTVCISALWPIGQLQHTQPEQAEVEALHAICILSTLLSSDYWLTAVIVSIGVELGWFQVLALVFLEQLQIWYKPPVHLKFCCAHYCYSTV